MEWTDLQYVLALDESGSWSEAAQALRVSPTTVMRRVASLEKALGAKLVERSVAGLGLTAAGQAARDAAAKARVAIDAFQTAVHDGDQRMAGTVRVLANESMALFWLPEVLMAFQRRQPQVRFELLADAEPVDLEAGGADIGLRLTRPPEQTLVARKVASLAFGLYASHRYLTAHPPLARGRGFSGHRLLLYDRWLTDSSKSAQLRQWLETAVIALKSNTLSALLPAAAAGGGLAVLPRFVADGYPGLHAVDGPVPVPGCELWLVVRRSLQRTARVRAVLEHLDAAFRRDARRLEAAR